MAGSNAFASRGWADASRRRDAIVDSKTAENEPGIVSQPENSVSIALCWVLVGLGALAENCH